MPRYFFDETGTFFDETGTRAAGWRAADARSRGAGGGRAGVLPGHPDPQVRVVRIAVASHQCAPRPAAGIHVERVAAPPVAQGRRGQAGHAGIRSFPPAPAAYAILRQSPRAGEVLFMTDHAQTACLRSCATRMVARSARGCQRDPGPSAVGAPSRLRTPR